jgi:hypothetical protein
MKSREEQGGRVRSEAAEPTGPLWCRIVGEFPILVSRFSLARQGLPVILTNLLRCSRPR